MQCRWLPALRRSGLQPHQWRHCQGADAPHGVHDSPDRPEQSDERRSAAHRRQHGEARFESAPLPVDLLPKISLQQLVAIPAVFQILFACSWAGGAQRIKTGNSKPGQGTRVGLDLRSDLQVRGGPEDLGIRRLLRPNLNCCIPLMMINAQVTAEKAANTRAKWPRRELMRY